MKVVNLFKLFILLITTGSLFLLQIGIEKKSCIQVYDNVYNCLPTMAKAQIDNIMWSQESAIEVCFMVYKCR